MPARKTKANTDLPNEAQVVLLNTYFEGQFSHWLQDEGATPRTAQDVEALIRDSGEADTLLLFLWRELGTAEGCEDLRDAYNRCESARSDVEQISNALAKALHPKETVE